ncbi:ty3-gypsy retrotransposon protein [Tanacetum coccineum]
MTEEANFKTAPSVDKKVSTTGNSSKTSKTNASTSARGKCVLLNDEGKPLEKIDYTGDHDSEDEVEPIDNEMASFMASKPSGLVMCAPTKVGAIVGTTERIIVLSLVFFHHVDEKRKSRLLLKDQSDAFTARLIAIQAKLEETKNLLQVRHGGGGDHGSVIPRAMRLDVPKFNGADPDSWIFSINEYFELLDTPVDQRLKVVGFNLEGEAAEWFRWMTRNKLINTWDGFLENVHNRFGPSKYEDPQGTLSKLLQTEAFSLATVTEARLDDQRSPTSLTATTATSVVQQKPSATRVLGAKADAGKPSLLPTPAATTKPLAIKWISPAERQERLNKGLCFNCGDTGQELDADAEEAVESGDISILNSLIGHGSPRSLQLWGTIGTRNVHVLIDNGSTHNFVRPDVVEKMQLNCLAIDKSFQWLQKLGKVTHDYAQQTMDFILLNVTYSLKGDESLRISRISLHRMQALLEADDIYGVYEFHSLQMDGEGDGGTPVGSKAERPKIEQLLGRFASLFQEHQFYVKRSKCVFGAATLKYLGHIISRNGVEMDPKKVKAVCEWPVPKSQRQVRGFLGLAGYYCRFIQGYATMAALLTNLLRKDGFKWKEEESAAFEAIKRQLSTAPILGLPDFEHTFIVEMDASADGIGAVLIQNDRPICYFSLIQTPIQQKYVRKLMGFDFAIEYKPEALNQVADALSRVYEDEEPVTSSFMAMSQPLVGVLDTLKSENESLKELIDLHQKLDRGELSAEFRRENGLLLVKNRYYIGSESTLKAMLLREFHDTPSAGHGGIKKMLVGLAALFYWKGMRKSVEDYIKCCLVCQQTKYSTQAPGGYLQPLPTPTAVWEDVSMDFITGLPNSKGVTVIFVVVDRFTKYAHFGTLPTNFNAHKVAEVFLEIVIKHHGLPKTIVSDRDPIFVSKFWNQLFLLSGTHLNHSTAYHPQTNGQTEVVNRGLEQYLRAMVSTRPEQWVRFLPWAEYCYNTSYHSSIRMSLSRQCMGVAENLLAAKHGMEIKANRKRREVEFKVGDMVLVKLQPYLQLTLAKRLSNKLAKRYYGPYEVMERIGKVAYRLALPATSRIHLVFHVSILKGFLGDGSEVVAGLPEEFHEGQPVEQPLAVCDMCEVLQNGEPTRQILVQWAGGSPEEATWEWLSEFQEAYPSYNLEDKVAFEERRKVTPARTSVTTRRRVDFKIKKVPCWGVWGGGGGGWQRTF